MRMDQFLKSYFPSIKALKTEKLPGDGGHREYTRIRSGAKTFMLMSCGEGDISLKHFIETQKRLSPIAPVPKIFQAHLKWGLLLLEDLGDQSLERFFLQKGERRCLPFYRQALTHLIRLQTKMAPLKNDPVFDKSFFIQENETALYHLQAYISRRSQKKAALFSQKSSADFKKDMESLLLNFKPEDYVYCHRDYHSRNLLLKNGQTFLIDFQDAGQGPWPYDLTSLLYDSYVPLEPSAQERLALFYWESLPSSFKKKACSFARLKRMIKLQFLQRGLKACGCFAAFQNLSQKSSHLKYIPPTLAHIKNIAQELSYRGIYKYIQQLTEALGERSAGP